MRTFDDAQLENELRVLVKCAGNVANFIRDFSYPHNAIVYAVMLGKKTIPASLARVLGYESAVVPLCDGQPRSPAHHPMRWKRINPTDTTGQAK